MKNGYKKIITSRGLRTFIFLVLAYFSQVNSFYHESHFHDGQLLSFENNTTPIEADVTQSSEHHHHDEGNVPQTKNHQHTYEKQFDWHLLRTQTTKIVTLNTQCFYSSILFNTTDDNNFTYVDYIEPEVPDESFTTHLIIRGPPSLG